MATGTPPEPMKSEVSGLSAFWKKLRMLAFDVRQQRCRLDDVMI